MLEACVKLAFVVPLLSTSNWLAGSSVPIPTFPSGSILIFVVSLPLFEVLKFKATLSLAEDPAVKFAFNPRASPLVLSSAYTVPLTDVCTLIILLNVHALVLSIHLIVLSVVPFSVIPPPSAVTSVGVLTTPSSMFLSSINTV